MKDLNTLDDRIAYAKKHTKTKAEETSKEEIQKHAPLMIKKTQKRSRKSHLQPPSRYMGKKQRWPHI